MASGTIRGILNLLSGGSNSDDDVRQNERTASGPPPAGARPRGGSLIEAGLSPRSQAKLNLSRSDEREVVKRQVIRALTEGTEEERQRFMKLGLRPRPRRPGETGGGPAIFPGYHVFEPEELGITDKSVG